MPGVRMRACDAVLTAKVPRTLAAALRDEARRNCRTISGEIRLMLQARFAQSQDVDDGAL